MDEKDKLIQDLRRENERLRKWVDELEGDDLETKLNQVRKIAEWSHDNHEMLESLGISMVIEAEYGDRFVMAVTGTRNQISELAFMMLTRLEEEDECPLS